jgi:hypothetical protein
VAVFCVDEKTAIQVPDRSTPRFRPAVNLFGLMRNPDDANQDAEIANNGSGYPAIRAQKSFELADMVDKRQIAHPPIEILESSDAARSIGEKHRLARRESFSLSI